MTTPRFELGADDVRELLAELDVRLRARGASAAVFVVGGAAIAVAGIRRGRLTVDVDALTLNHAVISEARQLARERGLPEDWLNRSASMWMPPLPAGVLDEPSEPGLRVTYADDGFLLATKLVAQRAKDADDIRALAQRVGLGRADAKELAHHILRYYTDSGALELMLGTGDVESEVALRAQDAAQMLARPADQ